MQRRELEDKIVHLYNGLLLTQTEDIGVYTGIEGILIFKQLFSTYFNIDNSVSTAREMENFLEVAYLNKVPCWLQWYKVHRWIGSLRLYLDVYLYFPDKESTQMHGSADPTVDRR